MSRLLDVSNCKAFIDEADKFAICDTWSEDKLCDGREESDRFEASIGKGGRGLDGG